MRQTIPPYVQRTIIIDATTGEVVDERTERLIRHRARTSRTRRAVGWRPAPAPQLLTREASDLLLAGLLVTVMGLALWVLASTPGAV